MAAGNLRDLVNNVLTSIRYLNSHASIFDNCEMAPNIQLIRKTYNDIVFGAITKLNREFNPYFLCLICVQANGDSVSPCGHLFCTPCISVGNIIYCTACKKNFKHEEIIKLKFRQGSS